MMADLPWELRELAKSVHYANMSCEFKKFAVEHAKGIGSVTADGIRKVYGAISSKEELTDIIQLFGARVYLNNNTDAPDRLSEYDEEKKLIICYNRQIDRIQSDKQPVFQPVSLLALCLAHELFHHLEAVKIGKVSDQVKISYKIFGFLRFHRRIEATREIAAHAFVMRLFNLTTSPSDMMHF